MPPPQTEVLRVKPSAQVRAGALLTHLWTLRGRPCTHPPKQSSTCGRKCDREWTGTAHWWSQTGNQTQHWINTNGRITLKYCPPATPCAPWAPGRGWFYPSDHRSDRLPHTPSAQGPPSAEPRSPERGPWGVSFWLARQEFPMDDVIIVYIYIVYI